MKLFVLKFPWLFTTIIVSFTSRRSAVAKVTQGFGLRDVSLSRCKENRMISMQATNKKSNKGVYLPINGTTSEVSGM